MKKRVIVEFIDLYNLGGVSTIIYQTGKPFPTTWKWLANLMTDWTTVSEDVIKGEVSDEYIYQTYGEDVEIY